MTDYNLGRATGEVIITADVDQATRGLGEYERATNDASDAAQRHSVVERELTERRRVATDAARRRKDAESEYKRVMANSTATTEQQNRAEEERNRARGEHLQAARRAANAERAYRAEIAGNTEAVAKFVRTLDGSSGSMDRHSRGMREMGRDAKSLSRDIDGVTKSLSGMLGMIAKLGAIGMGGAAAGGLLGLLGAGGAQGVMTALGGVVAIVSQLSGALLLLPAAIGGAVVGIGALKIGLNGVSEAFKSFDDPKKFIEAIKEMAPAARSVMIELQSFNQVFKGARQQIQQSLFEPIMNDVAPLVNTLLPLLTQGLSTVARVIGEAGHEFASWLQGADTISGINDFITNTARGLKALEPAIRPFADALLTLSVIGSTFFEQLSDSIVASARSFNEWVQAAAANGNLQRWIQNGIDGFKQIWDIIKNLGAAIKNIFDLSDGGGVLSFIHQISAEFRAWTESVSGQASIGEFFDKLRVAGGNLMPIIKAIGGIIGSLIGTMVDLGNSTASGALDFFKSLGDSVKSLGPNLVASAPAINDFLRTIGKLISTVVENVGPQLPQFFSSVSESAKDLVAPLDLVSKGIGFLMANLSPEMINVLAGLVVGLKGLSGALGGVSGLVGMVGAARTAMTGLSAAFTFLLSPAGLIVVAIAAVVAIVVLIATHWEETKQVASALWDTLKNFGSWIASTFVGAWNSLYDSVRNAWNGITEWIGNAVNNIKNFFLSLPGEALNWGRNLISNLAAGIRDSIGSVLQPVIDTVASLFPDSWKTNSPAKRGPLNQTSPNEMGGSLVKNLAEGITSNSDVATDAADSVAGDIGGSFSSAGVAGRSGQAGKSGFSQWVEGITGDLRQIGQFAQSAFGLFKDVFTLFTNTAKVVASLWNGGDNPMTRKGGMFADPDMPEGMPGKAPMPEIVSKGESPLKQKDFVSGSTVSPWTGQSRKMPSDSESGRAMERTSPINARPGESLDTPISSERRQELGIDPSLPPIYPSRPPDGQVGTAQQPGPTGGPVKVNADGFSDNQKNIAGKIISEGRKRGLNDDQILAALTIAGGESNFGDNDVFNTSGGNASVGGVGGVFQQAPKYYGGKENVMNPDIAIPAFLDRYVKDLQTNKDPMTAAIHVQNPQLGVPNSDSRYAREVGARRADAAALLAGAQAAPQDVPAAKPSNKRVVNADAFGGVDLKDSETTLIGPGGNTMIPGGGGPGAQAERRGKSARGYVSDQDLLARVPVGEYVTPEDHARGQDWDLAKGLADCSSAIEDLTAWMDNKPTGGRTLATSTAADVLPGLGFQRGKGDDGDFRIGYNANHMQATLPGGTPFNWGSDKAAKLRGQDGSEGAFDPSFTDFWHRPANWKAPGTPTAPNGQPLIGGGAYVPPNVQGAYDPNKPLVGNGQQGVPGFNSAGDYDPNKPLIGNGAMPAGFPQAKPGVGSSVASGQNVIDPVQAAPEQGGKKSPMDQATDAIASVGSIAGDAFAVFNDVLNNIDATAGLLETAVRGPENTEDIMRSIDQLQTFLVTAADVAKLVGSVASTASGASGGTDFGASSAVSAVAGIVQSGISAVNQGIELGQQAYRIVSKYGAMFAGIMLGGGETGPLGGNVRMLLNTNTGEIYTYSQDNPDQKNVKNIPSWMDRSYGGLRDRPQIQQTQLNLYTGANASPNRLISDTLWLVNNGAASTSVSGLE